MANLDNYSLYREAGISDESISSILGNAPEVGSLSSRPTQAALQNQPYSIPSGGSSQVAPKAPNGGVSFDDPLFVEELMSTGSPEMAEKRWAELTGWNNIKQSIDSEVLLLKRANPQLAGWQADLITQTKQAEVMRSAPGLQALAVAKQRLSENQKAADGLFQSMDYNRKSAVTQLMADKSLPFNQAVFEVGRNMPVVSGSVDGKTEDPFGELFGQSKAGGGTGESMSPQTVGLIAGLRDAATRVRYFNFMRERPEVTDQAVRNAIGTLNQADVAIDEKDPDSAARAEQVQKSKTDAKFLLDAVTELNQRGESPVLLADKDTFYSSAMRSVKEKKPVAIKLPGGGFDYRGFSNEDEIFEYQKTLTQAEREQLAKSLPPEYKPGDGIVEKAKRFTGFKDLENIEKDLAYYAKQAKDPAKSVADQTDATLQVKELEELRGKKSKDKEKRGVISEYMKLEEMQSRLREQSSNPKLDRDQRDRVRTELAAVKQQIDDIKRHPAIVEYFKMISDKADAIPWL
jgi:hypothetical protein